MTARAHNTIDPDDASVVWFAQMQTRYVIDTAQWNCDVAGWTVDVSGVPMAHFTSSNPKTAPRPRRTQSMTDVTGLGAIHAGRIMLCRRSGKSSKLVKNIKRNIILDTT